MENYYYPEMVEVTPALAAEWLEKNVANNRPVRAVDVSKFARDMMNGNWRLTHQGIAFNTEGRLIDGQHRLRAVVQSKCTVPMMVWHNLPEECLPMIDIGLARTARDSIGFMTSENAYTSKIVISTMRMIYRISNNLPQKTKFSPTELYDIMHANDNLVHGLHYLITHKHTPIKSSAYFASLMFAVASGESLQDVLNFDKMATHAIITPGAYNYQAAVKFRYWYGEPGHDSNAEEFISYCCKCIYCFIHNRKFTKEDRYRITADQFARLNDIVDALEIKKYWTTEKEENDKNSRRA